MGFDQFKLAESIRAGMTDMGYKEPTPIQERAIPAALEGKDVIGVAQTGTGKTAAFLLPILDQLLERHEAGEPQSTGALIVAPTRELAVQIDEVRIGLCYHTPISGCVVYGGANMINQTRALRGKPDVVTATPGRFLDHLWHGLPELDRVQILVLDEADRMLDMGFLPDIEKILRRLPETRQNLLFSATMPAEIERLARQIMHDPVTITVGPKATPVDTVRQELFDVHPHDKTRLLLDLLRGEELRSVLIFTRTKVGADQIHREIRKTGITCEAIHGDRDQKKRMEALESFRHGQVRVLVATDVASRGIDVTGISHVVNYDVPRSPEDYVHRIGRTGRAGEKGHAITFATSEERRDVVAIERLIRMEIPRGTPSQSPRSQGDGRRSSSRSQGNSSSSRNQDRRHSGGQRGGSNRGRSSGTGRSSGSRSSGSGSSGSGSSDRSQNRDSGRSSKDSNRGGSRSGGQKRRDGDSRSDRGRGGPPSRDGNSGRRRPR